MRYLLDTNVVSELRKSPERVDPQVLGWAHDHPARALYLSVITVMEIELGIARAERRDQRQGQALRAWMTTGVLAGFAGRILPVDTEVAVETARLHVPNPRPERDAYLAATARIHGLTVVTRNVADFDTAGVALLNPWDRS